MATIRFDEDSLTEAIKEGLVSEGFQNLNDYLLKLSRGVAKGIIKKIEEHTVEITVGLETVTVLDPNYEYEE